VPDLPYHLAFLEILPPGHYSTVEPEQAGNDPVGSGPYRLEDWIPGKEVALAAVPSYWGGAPRWSHIVFRSVPDLQDRLSALSSGAASLVTDLPPIQADRWDVAGTRLEAIESTTRMLIGIHAVPDTPLADRQVRQALNYGVDVAQVVDEWLEGYGERYGSWVNPPGNNPALEPWPYDPELAQELLAEAGYADGLEITLTTPSGAYYQDAAIAQEWPYNPTGWQEPLFEQQLQLASTTFDPQARATALDELQALAYDEAPWIWLWRPYRFYGVSQYLDWTPRRDGLVNLYEPRSQ